MFCCINCLFLRLNGFRDHLLSFAGGHVSHEAPLESRHLFGYSLLLQAFVEVQVSHLPHIHPVNVCGQLRHALVLTSKVSLALSIRQLVAQIEQPYPDTRAGGWMRVFWGGL